MGHAPLYEVINRDLTSQITSGKLKPGHQLESESSLASHYGVSRMTVRQALGQLESDGLVARRHGAGTFVREPREIERQAGKLAPFSEEMGLDPDDITTRIILREVVVPDVEVSRKLFPSTGPTTVHLIRVRSYLGSPVALQISWIPYLRATELAHIRLIKGSLYRTLAEKANIHITRATQKVSAVIASEEQTKLLNIEAGSPLIHISRVAFTSSGEPIEVAECFMLSSFPLVLELQK